MNNSYLDVSSCLSDKQLDRYLDGKMEEVEAHKAEKHMLFCRMCSDAAEGYSLLKEDDFTAFLEFQKKKNNSFSLRLMVLAAMSILLLGTGFYWLWYFGKSEIASSSQVADNTRKEVVKKTASHQIPPKVAEAQDGNGEEKKEIQTELKKEYETPIGAGIPSAEEGKRAASRTAYEGAHPAKEKEETMTADARRASSGKEELSDQSVVTLSATAPAVQQKHTGGLSGYTQVADVPSVTVTEDRGIGQDENKRLRERDKKKSDIEHVQQLMKDGKKFFLERKWNPAARCMKRVLEKSEDPEIRVEALWFGANAFLRLGDKEKARGYFLELTQGRSLYSEQAADTLRILQ